MSTKSSPDFVSKQVLQSQYLFLDLAPSILEPFSLVCVGRETCKPDYHLRRDGFHFHAIEFVISGKWELECDGAVHELGPGSVFAYSPDTVFSLRAKTNDAQLKYFLDFDGGDAAQALELAGLTAGVPLVVLPIHWVREIFDQILDCHRFPKSVAKEMGTLLTRLLILRIRQDGRAHLNVGRDSFDTYQRCRNYIRHNYRDLHTVEEVGSACHVDRAYLSRLFKKHAGESPYQLLTRMKMEHAAECLRNQRTSVKAVANEVGYEDPFHFSRVFKKCFGLSPKHYSMHNRS